MFARLPIPLTDQLSKSWPLVALGVCFAGAEKKYKSAIDRIYAYERITLNHETTELTVFLSVEKLYSFNGRFMQPYVCFMGSKMSNFKSHMLKLIQQLLTIAKIKKSGNSSKKPFFMLLTVEKLSHEISFITAKLPQSKVTATTIFKIPSLTTKLELIMFIGPMKFSSVFFW